MYCEELSKKFLLNLLDMSVVLALVEEDMEDRDSVVVVAATVVEEAVVVDSVAVAVVVVEVDMVGATGEAAEDLAVEAVADSEEAAVEAAADSRVESGRLCS